MCFTKFARSNRGRARGAGMKLTVIAIGVLGVAVACGLAAFTKSAESGSPSPAMTPARGPSWLKHLGIRLADTRMGHIGGTDAAPATARREPGIAQRETAQALRENFELTGADLYRINCRSCHGPTGEGASPEIPSLIGPAQGTSTASIEHRMEQRGAPISEEMATQMASQAEQAIRDRLQKGGKKMPAFAELRPEEITALFGYLRQLANVPGKQEMLPVNESAGHVGEEVIKGTCHICHDATGPGGSRMMIMMRGMIPSLASLPEYQSLDEVLRQVHYGSRMMMMMGGSRMPPLPYFTDQEIAAAYFYLRAYPPVK